MIPKRLFFLCLICLLLLTHCQTTPIIDAVGQVWQYQPSLPNDDSRFSTEAAKITFYFHEDGTYQIEQGRQIAAYVIDDSGTETEEVQSFTNIMTGTHTAVDNELHFTLTWLETGSLLHRRTNEMPPLIDSPANDQLECRLFWQGDELKLAFADIETIVLDVKIE